MENQTSFNCSCPKCGQVISITMKYNKDEVHVMDAVSDILGKELRLEGNYTYSGEIVCGNCGKVVIACLTVSAQSVKSDTD